MAELAQWMIDAGATFFDAAGNPTRPDGTPVVDLSPPPTQENLGMGPPVVSDDPMFIGIGPPYTESTRTYSGPAPLDPGIFNDMYMEGAPEPGQLRYEGGVAMPTNWQDFKGNTSTGGGFFTLDQIFANGLPEVFQSGSQMPSTNNWRLLPGGRPGLVMRNGRIIDTTDTEGLFGPYGMGEFGGRYSNPRWRSGSALGVPSAHAFGSISHSLFGWPGQLDPIGYTPAAN